MSFAYPLTGLATVAALLVFIWTGRKVSGARREFGIKAPATSGDPGFDRVFRVQMNTLEQMALFLPALWLAAVVSHDLWAAILGAVWVVGRLVYATAYYRDAAARGPGFVLTVVPTFILLILALVFIIKGMIS